MCYFPRALIHLKPKIPIRSGLRVAETIQTRQSGWNPKTPSKSPQTQAHQLYFKNTLTYTLAYCMQQSCPLLNRQNSIETQPTFRNSVVRPSTHVLRRPKITLAISHLLCYKPTMRLPGRLFPPPHRPGGRRGPPGTPLCERAQPMPGGRPTKLTSEVRSLVRKYAPLALTDKQFASVLDVTEQTFNNWKKDKEFFESLKADKADADEHVRKSLYAQALEGNTTACIFWLKNRQPKSWRDKQEVDHTGTIVFQAPDVTREVPGG